MNVVPRYLLCLRPFQSDALHIRHLDGIALVVCHVGIISRYKVSVNLRKCFATVICRVEHCPNVAQQSGSVGNGNHTAKQRDDGRDQHESSSEPGRFVTGVCFCKHLLQRVVGGVQMRKGGYKLLIHHFVIPPPSVDF